MPGGSLTCRIDRRCPEHARDPTGSSSRARSHAASRRTMCRPRRAEPGNPEADQRAWNRSIAICRPRQTLEALAPLNAQTCRPARKTGRQGEHSGGEGHVDSTAGGHGQRGRAGGRFPGRRPASGSALSNDWKREQAAPDLVAYVKFRFLSADYGHNPAAARRRLCQGPAEMVGGSGAVCHGVRRHQGRGRGHAAVGDRRGVRW